MDRAEVCSSGARPVDALAAEDPSVRLRAALAVGTHPELRLLEALVQRCAVEPDFYVRDMLTWALTRYPADRTVPVLCQQLQSEQEQARSQALHTLSKVGDRRAWPAITRSLLRDADDEVARAAWRAAVVLVPAGEERALALELATQLGRGDRDVQLSLSRALIGLGEAIESVLERAEAGEEPRAAAHAGATRRLLREPDAGFELAVDEARRIVALGPGPFPGSAC